MYGQRRRVHRPQTKKKIADEDFAKKHAVEIDAMREAALLVSSSVDPSYVHFTKERIKWVNSVRQYQLVNHGEYPPSMAAFCDAIISKIPLGHKVYTTNVNTLSGADIWCNTGIERRLYKGWLIKVEVESALELSKFYKNMNEFFKDMADLGKSPISMYITARVLGSDKARLFAKYFEMDQGRTYHLKEILDYFLTHRRQ